MPEVLTLAKKIADICFDRIAKNTIVLDLHNKSIMCDYFVIANAPTRVQLNDIKNSIYDILFKEKIFPLSIQGQNDNSWILLDYGSVIVHLFLDQERDFYNLEGLWREAPIVYAPQDPVNIEQPK